jgi:site-specific DNA-cytosine methylase
MKTKFNYVNNYKCTYEKVIQISKWKSFTNPIKHIYGLGSISPTITTTCGGRLNSQNILVSTKLQNEKDISKDINDKHYITSLNIRFITPRECGRLMGVNEKDINAMFSVNKEKQLFIQYGNSIVVDVLYYALKPLFEKDGVNGR